MSVLSRQLAPMQELWRRSYQNQLPAETRDAVVPQGVTSPEEGAPTFGRVLVFLLSAAAFAVPALQQLIESAVIVLGGNPPPPAPGSTQLSTNVTRIFTVSSNIDSALAQALSGLTPADPPSSNAQGKANAVSAQSTTLGGLSAARAAIAAWAGGETVASTYAAWAAINAPQYPTAADATLDVLCQYIASEIS